MDERGAQGQTDATEDWIWYRAVERGWYRHEDAAIVAHDLFLPVEYVRRLYTLLDTFWPGMAAARVRRERNAKLRY